LVSFVYSLIIQGQQRIYGVKVDSVATVHQTNKTPSGVCILEGGRGGKGKDAPGGILKYHP